VILISLERRREGRGAARKPAYDFAAQIRQLKEPIDPDSPFMIEWWSSPTPVEEDFIRRQRRTRRRSRCACGWRFLDQGLFDGDLQRIDADLQRTLPGSRRRRCSSGAAPIPSWRRRCAGACASAAACAGEGLPGVGAQPFWEDPQHCADVINAFLTAAPSGAARSR